MARAAGATSATCPRRTPRIAVTAVRLAALCWVATRCNWQWLAPDRYQRPQIPHRQLSHGDAPPRRRSGFIPAAPHRFLHGVLSCVWSGTHARRGQALLSMCSRLVVGGVNHIAHLSRVARGASIALHRAHLHGGRSHCPAVPVSTRRCCTLHQALLAPRALGQPRLSAQEPHARATRSRRTLLRAPHKLSRLASGGASSFRRSARRCWRQRRQLSS